ncbi:MAG TPA: RHS repeat-associated core domain-containing protein [Anaerolineales bacterium]
MPPRCAGMTVAMKEGGNLNFLLTDHLGSVAATTDSAGALLDQQRYMPFGKVRENAGTITQTDFGYTGQRDLPSMGLMDYKARMYDAGLGRFIQPDTIIPNAADPQGWNRYSYVQNAPIMYTDPSGMHRDCGLMDSSCIGTRREWSEWRKYSKSDYDTFNRAKDAYEEYYKNPEKAFQDMLAPASSETTGSTDSYVLAGIYSENVVHHVFDPLSDNFVMDKINDAASSGQPVPQTIWALFFGLGIEQWLLDNYGTNGAVHVGKFPATSSSSYLYRTDRSGVITAFAAYDDAGDVIYRVDLIGKPHGGVPTPHIQYSVWDVNPTTGRRYMRGWTRALPWP